MQVGLHHDGLAVHHHNGGLVDRGLGWGWRRLHRLGGQVRGRQASSDGCSLRLLACNAETKIFLLLGNAGRVRGVAGSAWVRVSASV